ncbi:phosphotransferase [Cocleimonas sp. KMM 6892]|uniref:hypothetical protein n=1 Tax=unclassified Cocleimonas TaxID=2639732 RepID=UPI002DB62AE6|nr:MULTISPECIES: hypothetical protein [unclassified Cocleimonas]MEB8434135.1 phosphotransferase [Cocleimonas sp. KMM 6892]MEC4717005.1 phosphotransferase [Cocleimonas sp. KMM 6895]MEC4746407.1 phosphotransferase [Cocleimonas sp. KMM 6896]
MKQKDNKKIPAALIETLPNEIAAENAEFIPQRFADSTHDLWRLKSTQGNYFLKVCSNTESPFWQIMQQLFGVDLRNDIASFNTLYGHISSLSSLKIPELIQSQSSRQHGSYILTPEVDGLVPDNSKISVGMVEQLAQHLANLHQDRQNNWGSIHQPIYNSGHWKQRLRDTLEKSAHKWGGDKTTDNAYLNAALDACEQLNVNEFVPVMPDLRWDQFLITKNNLELILLDLDAFVLAPRELDFVLLEYLLDQQQFECFVEVYSRHHTIPELKYARSAYRLLLFYMEVLGEQDIDKWMNLEHRF